MTSPVERTELASFVISRATFGVDLLSHRHLSLFVANKHTHAGPSRQRTAHCGVSRLALSAKIHDASYERGKAASSQGIYVPEESSFFPGAVVAIPLAERQHLRARRIRGGSVLLFNGVGGAAVADLASDGSSAVVMHEAQTRTEHPTVTACFAPPKSASRADWAIEKLTELGAVRLSSLCSARGECAPSEVKFRRWARLSVAACKQSMGNALPTIDHFGGINDIVCAVQEYDCALLLSPSGLPIMHQLARCDIGKSKKEDTSLLIVAGPEGGFTEEEETVLIGAGCISAALGHRRLRIETAIVTAMAAVRFFADSQGFE